MCMFLECVQQNSTCGILSQVVAVAHPGDSDSVFHVFENFVWVFSAQNKIDFFQLDYDKALHHMDSVTLMCEISILIGLGRTCP